MERHGLVKMVKVEVIVGGDDAAIVRDLFTASGVTGYTGVSGVSGMGHGGRHEGRLLFNDRDALAMLITVLPEERLDELVGGLRALLEHRSGVLFVTETWVSRPEYFLGD